MENKRPWESKTVLIGAISGLLGAVALFVPAAGSALAWLNSHGADIALVWGFLAVGLRLISKDKISLRD